MVWDVGIYSSSFEVSMVVEAVTVVVVVVLGVVVVLVATAVKEMFKPTVKLPIQ